jgi:hypothetical protein
MAEPSVDCPDLTARQLYQAMKARPPRPPFGFGEKAAILNVDLQKAFTAVGEFPDTAYETHPQQLDYVNQITVRCHAGRSDDAQPFAGTARRPGAAPEDVRGPVHPEVTA